ncbi:MAG: WD40 repeat domain-containing protein [Gemmataceae bacterium]
MVQSSCQRLALAFLLCWTPALPAQDDTPFKGKGVDKYGDPLPPGAMARLGTQRFQGAVGGMVFSPDGKTLAALNGSSVLHLYDVATGAVLHRFTPTRAGGWTALAFSPDGKRLASCGVTNRVCLWDVESRRLLRDFAGHTDSVATLAFSPDGKTLATGSRDKTVRLWDVASGKPLHPALAADSLVTGVAFSPKGDRLASVCFDRRVSVWNVATGKLVDQIEGTCLCLRNILFMPDGLVVTSAFDGKVAVWDLAARRQVEVLPAHKGEASGLSLSRDGSVLVTSGQDQCIRIWDWRKRTDLIPPLPRPEWVPYLAVSPDGTTVAAADFHNSRVQVWRLVQVGAAIEARPILPEEGHGGSVNKLRYFPDGKRFLSRGLDYTVRVWDELTRKELYRISHVDVIAISPDSKLLALAERNDGSRMAITIYDAAKGTPIKTWRHSSQVWALAFARDGRSLLVGGTDNHIHWIEVATGKPRLDLDGHKNAIASLTLAPDGLTLLSGAWDNGRIWDLLSGETLETLEHADSVGSMAISPDGRWLACEQHKTGIHVRKFLGDAKPRRLPGPGAFDLAFSRDGQTLVAACKDEKLRIWDVASGKLLKEWQGHTGWQMSVAFSPDGRTLLTGGGDCCIVMWPYDSFLKAEPIVPAPLPFGELQERLDKLKLVRLGHDRRLKKAAEAWPFLAGPDAADAYHAILSLAAHPKESVPLMKKELTALLAAPVADLLTDLDSATPKRRADAQTALAKLGGLVEPRLRRHLAAAPGLEARAWLERHLALRESGAPSPHDEGLRVLRALEVLEMLGNDEARGVLQAIARQTAYPEMAQEARASLGRLAPPR